MPTAPRRNEQFTGHGYDLQFASESTASVQEIW
jgi:hypothetical protein